MLNQVENRTENRRIVSFKNPSEHIKFSRCYKQVFTNGKSLSRVRVFWKGEFVAAIFKRSDEKMWSILYVNKELETVEFSHLRGTKNWLKNETKKVGFMEKLDRLVNKVGLKFERTSHGEYDIYFDGKEVGFVYQPSTEEHRVCLSITNKEFIKMIPGSKGVYAIPNFGEVKEFLSEYIH